MTLFLDSTFPVDALITELCQALASGRNAVLQAPPGAGKTTRLPLALFQQAWLKNKKILMLEPRRLAARAAATFMAKSLGEAVGETVGFRIRFDSKISARTRIEVVTEGILTRLLQRDPALSDIGLVIFDEFHERSLHADLALALCRQTQQVLRDDLRILVMSATLDAAPVARLLNDAPLLTSNGISFPVETRYVPTMHTIKSSDLRALPEQISGLILRALHEESGNILVFLPGQSEINHVAKRLQVSFAENKLSDNIIIAPLYGDLSADAQDAALSIPPHGKRKIVLATSIAETSLTIPGIRIVIDSGWARLPVFDQSSGMSRLQTVRVSRASADQRQGRAGRLESGVCYRPWSEHQHAGFAAHTAAEILQADLTPMLLDSCAWGVSAAHISTELDWLDAPPAASIAQAQELLQRLGAITLDGKITDHGRAMNELPLHPRLSHMLIKAHSIAPHQQPLAELACRLAALLSERDILRRENNSSSDIVLRLQALRQSSAAVHHATRQRVLQAAKQWQQQFKLTANSAEDDGFAGLLLAFAYPDRIAQHRPTQHNLSQQYPDRHGQFVLANGRGAQLQAIDYLSTKPYLVAAELDGQTREARIFLAAELCLDELLQYAPESITTVDRIEWSDKNNVVIAQREQRLGELILRSDALTVSNDQLAAGLCAGIRSKGLAALPWTDLAKQFIQRINFLHRSFSNTTSTTENPWTLLADDYLLSELEVWLQPFLTGMSRLSHIEKIDLLAALKTLFSWEQLRQVDLLAPLYWIAPTGTQVQIDYSADMPVIAVKLQEVFGQHDTPSLADGRVPVLFHLLSPARRPIAISDDLARFWQVGYPEVKKDMKGRYPKHPWPDDPLAAVPTRYTKNKSKKI